MLHVSYANIYPWAVAMIASLITADSLYALSGLAGRRRYRTLPDDERPFDEVLHAGPDRIRYPMAVSAGILVLFTIHFLQSGTSPYYGPAEDWDVEFYLLAAMSAFALMYCVNSLAAYSALPRGRTIAVEVVLTFPLLAAALLLLFQGKPAGAGMLFAAWCGFSLQTATMAVRQHRKFRSAVANMPAIYLVATLASYIAIVLATSS